MRFVILLIFFLPCVSQSATIKELAECHGYLTTVVVGKQLAKDHAPSYAKSKYEKLKIFYMQGALNIQRSASYQKGYVESNFEKTSKAISDNSFKKFKSGDMDYVKVFNQNVARCVELSGLNMDDFPEQESNLTDKTNNTTYPYVLDISCSILGTTPVEPSLCFFGYSGGTQLEIQNGRDYKIYTMTMLSNPSVTGITLQNNSILIPLHEHFEVSAQTALQNGLLNLKVKDANTKEILFEKAAAQYRLIRIGN